MKPTIAGREIPKLHVEVEIYLEISIQTPS